LPTRVAAVLDWLSLVALAVFIAYMTRWSYEVVATSWLSQSEANTTLATPLWIPQGMWLLGLVWMCVVLALMLLRASLALVNGDLQTLRAICGTRSAQEEAQEEAAAGERIIHEEQRA
jgi:TRAP-type C4-dicarboxylate transport system permease small subunit